MKITDFFKGFFVASADSLKNHLNGKELFQAIFSGVVTGGGYLAVVLALKESIGKIITNPVWIETLTNQWELIQTKNWVALGISIVTVVAMAIKKYYEGLPLIVYAMQKKVAHKDEK